MGSVYLLLFMALNAKNAATDIANRFELELRANRDAFLAGQLARDAALRKFDDAWTRFTGPDGCGSAVLRAYGKRCVEERGAGKAHDWFGWYRAPIADAVVISPLPPELGPPK